MCESPGFERTAGPFKHREMSFRDSSPAGIDDQGHGQPTITFDAGAEEGRRGARKDRRLGARGLGNARVRGAAQPSYTESWQLCSTLPRPHKTSCQGSQYTPSIKNSFLTENDQMLVRTQP